MKTYGTILVVSYQRNTLKTMIGQLRELKLYEYFEIEARTVDELFHSTIGEDTLVLISSRIVFTMAKPYLSQDTSYIIADRTINFAKIRQLLELPKGSKVLLVSDIKEAAEETVLILKEAGIDLDFKPFYPNARYDQAVRVAITPGESELTPPSVERTIDVGSRIIDISSIMEVFTHFNMPNAAFRQLSARYMQSLLHVTDQLSQEILQTKLLRNSLKQVVDYSDDAMLLLTKDGLINVINQKATDILNLDGSDVLGKPMTSSIHSSFSKAISSIKDDYDFFKDVDQITYYIRKKEIVVDGDFFGTVILFRKANEIQQIEHQYRNQTKSKNFIAKYSFEDIITRNESILETIKVGKKLAQSNGTILILGETGTGKEILAQAVHNASPRSYYPFVGVNFAAFSESLLESELFGYEKGAFTGASKNGRSGLFEQAHRGTLFLDEIGDAAPALQNRLLRVLQEKEIMRVGGEQVIPLDLRIVAATNKNLEEMIECGTFRKDLFYRLNVLPIYVPPLRDRPEDIPLLVRHLTAEIAREMVKSPLNFSDDAFTALKEYHWPGNIRELRNVAEYLMHVCEGTVFKEHLPFLSKQQRFINIKREDNQNFVDLLDDFKEKGFLKEMLMILRVLSENPRTQSGRNAILQDLHQLGICLTEQQLRYRLELLRDVGAISVHRGRKGTSISQKGKDFLNLCNKKSDI
ncbi:transcriptional regulator with PAS, ATPase and Fis domain [Scopulibacillus darangshiensis]|uniref:Transcriptional regulator with PAS, ATPase and Fis domain n=1 Tax=Scopulibacillus darangshiensis TaxID=442528 RepID=A0A4R2P4M0_9BACL|nr:sigma 54-interacting transcriptional regulator [Scopulibacillus darangshiensis]TCP29597.1 transcriptional regulator with PAS, ATPase and Fis domain [Scopulibacillus darangshiensis]